MKYLLTFKPLGHFFFGNERTFKEDYVAHSEYFPQPTQLLGALRLVIAQQYGLIKQYRNGRYTKDPQTLQALTGTAKAHTFMENDDLGKIAMLSPMFLASESLDDAYFPTPFDLNATITYGSHMMATESEEIIPVKYPQKVTLSYLTLANIGGYYYLDGYNVKHHSPQMLGNSVFWKAYLNGEERAVNALFAFEDSSEHKGIFLPHEQVGIALDKGKQTIDEKFYVKKDYTLNEGFLFACLLDFDGEIEDDYVQLGAEGSLFKMEVHPLSQTPLSQHPVIVSLQNAPKAGGKAVAISDVMVEHKDVSPLHFALVPYVKRSASLKRDKERYMGVHPLKQVAPAGSIFYLKEQESMPSNIGAYAKMGYNQFISL